MGDPHPRRSWHAVEVHPLRPLLRARLRAALADPVDHAVGAIAALVVAVVGMVFLWAVFHRVPDVAGWRGPEVLMVWGLTEMASGLCLCLFQGLWMQNQRYVMTGDLDRLLVRPGNPLLSLLVEHLAPGHLALAFAGLCMVVAAGVALPALPLSAWVALPAVALGGAALLGGMALVVSSVGLVVPHRGRTVGLVEQAAAFARYPLSIFPAWLAMLLVTVVPMGLVAAMPVAAALGRAPLVWGLAPMLAGAAALAVGVATWHLALRRYASTGT